MPFLEILYLKFAFKLWPQIHGSDTEISERVSKLTRRAYQGLTQLRHKNKHSVCRIYCRLEESQIGDPKYHGPIINFNILRPDGSQVVPVQEVSMLANANGIQMRYGSFCNPGAYQRYFNLSGDDIRQRVVERGSICDIIAEDFKQVKMKEDLDDEFMDDQAVERNQLYTIIPEILSTVVVAESEKTWGSIRVSFGASTTDDDIDKLLWFVREYYQSPVFTNCAQIPTQRKATLTRMFVYPIKSCHAMEVSETSIFEGAGLAYDREWMLVHSQTNSALTQKQCPRMVTIRPVLDVIHGVLKINVPGMDELQIPISDEYYETMKTDLKVNVCGKNRSTRRLKDDSTVSYWFSTYLKISVTLVRQSHTSFSNETSYLAVTEQSVEKLNSWMHPTTSIDFTNFRPNFVFSHSSLEAFEEDAFRVLIIGTQVFAVTEPCVRCRMISIDQETGYSSQQILDVLNQHRRVGGVVLFGIQLKHMPYLSQVPHKIQSGCEVGISQDEDFLLDE